MEDNILVINQDTFIKIMGSEGDYAFLLASMQKGDVLRKIISDTYKYDEDAQYIFTIENSIMPEFDNVNSKIKRMSVMFLAVGIGFAIFASLMLFNFISISISYKQHGIGILRAVGARSRDVFNFFFSESFIISMLS